MSKLNKAELQAHYKELHGADADDSLTKAQLTEEIVNKQDEVYPTLPNNGQGNSPKPAPHAPDPLEVSADGKSFKGNKSTERFPIDQKGMVVVRQTPYRIVEGNFVKLPNQSLVQTYTPEMYQQLTDSNFFTESQLDPEVLHQPS